MKRKDFIRNMLMGFAATLLPRVLLPSDGLIKSGGTYRFITGVDPYAKSVWTRSRGFVIYTGRDNYKKFNDELVMQYHGRKKSW